MTQPGDEGLRAPFAERGAGLEPLAFARSPALVSAGSPTARLGAALGPGALIVGKATARIINLHLMREIETPSPQYQILVDLSRARHEARNENAAIPVRSKPVSDQPRGRFVPLALAVEPTAGKLIQSDLVVFSTCFLAQVRNVVAVDIVFANRQRLQAMTEALCAFCNGGRDGERKIKGGLSLAVEASAGDRGPFAG